MDKLVTQQLNCCGNETAVNKTLSGKDQNILSNTRADYFFVFFGSVGGGSSETRVTEETVKGVLREYYSPFSLLL